MGRGWGRARSRERLSHRGWLVDAAPADPPLRSGDLSHFVEEDEATGPVRLVVPVVVLSRLPGEVAEAGG